MSSKTSNWWIGAGTSALALTMVALSSLTAPAYATAGPTPNPTHTAMPRPTTYSTGTPTPTTPPTPPPTPATHWDIAAVGDTASGAVGTVVHVSIGEKNLGPGAVPPHSGFGPNQGFKVTLPPGTQIVGMPTGCGGPPNLPFPGPATSCFNFPGLPAGQSLILEMDLRIVTFTPSALGKVETFYESGISGPPNGDTNSVNDTADIVINAPGNAAPALPTTGVPTLPFVIAGATALLVGALLVALTRRRRTN